MKEALFYLGNVSAIGYLVAIIGKQVYEANSLKKRIQSAQTEFDTSLQDMDSVRRDQLALITKAYGNQYGQDIAVQLDKRIYFEGMPMILLLTSLGLPDKIQDGNYKGVSTSKWYYGESMNRLGNPTYELEVTLEDYLVVGWRDLK